MAIGIILGIVFALVAIFAIGACAVCDSGVAKGIWGVIAVALIITFLIVPFSFRTPVTTAVFPLIMISAPILASSVQ